MIRVPGGGTGGEWGNPVRQRLFAEGVSQRDGPRFSAKDRRGGLRGARRRSARSYLGTTGDNSVLAKHPGGSWVPLSRRKLVAGVGARPGDADGSGTPKHHVSLSPARGPAVTRPPGRVVPKHRVPGARVPPGAPCPPVPGSSCRPAGTLRAPGKITNPTPRVCAAGNGRQALHIRHTERGYRICRDREG